jgi:hypothetical protein
MSLTLSALDERSRLENLLLLLDIAIDQLDGNDLVTRKLELLITCYLTSAKIQLDELNTVLERLRSQLRVISDSEQIDPPP